MYVFAEPVRQLELNWNFHNYTRRSTPQAQALTVSTSREVNLPKKADIDPMTGLSRILPIHPIGSEGPVFPESAIQTMCGEGPERALFFDFRSRPTADIEGRFSQSLLL